VNLSNLVTTINTNGFAILDGVLDLAETDGLIAAVGQVAQGGYALRQLHTTCHEVQQLCNDQRILSLARSVIGENAKVVRSLFFDKNDAGNWKVAWHQDLTIATKEKIELPGFGPWSVKHGIVHVQPPISVLENMITVRVHLDDCSTENGPLRVLPGTHRLGKLSADQIVECREEIKETICVVSRGGVVLMKPLILHASSPAAIPTHRRVIHLEFAAEKLDGNLEWAIA
jgi:ectoine hydroxylase-related dioxygenase (phytanoyl-CoA dioxygenase family)